MLDGVTRPSRPLVLAAAAAAAAVLALGSCSTGDGRTLAPIDPERTTTSGMPGPSSEAGPVGSQAEDGPIFSGEAPAFLVSSAAFDHGGELGPAHTCAGAGMSPPLSWTAPPPGAEVAVVLREVSDVGTVHWIVTGIDPVVLGFGEGGIPEGATQQVNASGLPGYFAPCPAAGTGTHLYEFTVHVLDAPLTVDPAEAAADLAARIESSSTVESSLTAVVTS